MLGSGSVKGNGAAGAAAPGSGDSGAGAGVAVGSGRPRANSAGAGASAPKLPDNVRKIGVEEPKKPLLPKHVLENIGAVLSDMLLGGFTGPDAASKIQEKKKEICHGIARCMGGKFDTSNLDAETCAQLIVKLGEYAEDPDVKKHADKAIDALRALQG